MKKLIRLTINIALLITLLFSGYSICERLIEYKKSDDVYTDIRKNVSNNVDSYDYLADINADYRFWIKIDKTNIDYPVLQGVDNSYYLSHDFNKEELISGSIFMDYRNDFEKSKNTVIYGHNMKDKSMFNNIEKYKSKEFFDEKNLISIEYKGSSYVYEVFSVYVADISKDYIKSEFSDNDEFEKYLDYISRKSLFKSDLNVSSKDNIITLYTCSYEFNNARTIAHAKLISN